MIDSKGSVVVGQQGPLDWLTSAVVVPDRRGQRQDALHDADPHSGRGVAAVAFEIELALEGVVDRLDDLPQRLEELFTASGALALAGWSQQVDPARGQVRLEVLAVTVPCYVPVGSTLRNGA